MPTPPEADLLWCIDPEHGIFPTITEALASYRDINLLTRLPETMIVYGYEREQVRPEEHNSGRYVEWLLEEVEERYGSPVGGGFKVTEEMRRAELTFITQVLEHYEPWTCTEVTSKTVRTRDYINVNG